MCGMQSWGIFFSFRYYLKKWKSAFMRLLFYKTSHEIYQKWLGEKNHQCSSVCKNWIETTQKMVIFYNNASIFLSHFESWTKKVLIILWWSNISNQLILSNWSKCLWSGYMISGSMLPFESMFSSIKSKYLTETTNESYFNIGIAE